MSVAYNQLLDGAIQHLQELKERGVRFVSLSPDTLAGLSQARPAAPARSPSVSPAPAPRPAAKPPVKPMPFTPKPAEPEPVLAQTLSVPLPGETQAPVAAPALSPEAKAAAFAQLRQRALACVRCPNLAAARKNVVFGVGDINAQLMFIGEAPGADEDDQGEPFVGKAGQLLTKIIVTMGLTRDTVYIGNILKCRPDTPGQQSGNRKPTGEEMKTCLPYLLAQIEIIQPKVLVALGATALEGLLGRVESVGKVRGKFQEFRNIPLMPTFHPAYLLRNQSQAEKRKVWEDMLQVMEKLQMPISEKQRRYFTFAG